MANFNDRNYGDGAVAVIGEDKIVAIGDLVPNPWNYNTQPDAMFTKLAESLRTFGFVQPVVVRQDEGAWQIINGEHRWRAAKLLGMTEIPVRDLGVLDDAKAKQLTIILNELGGTPDQVRLAELLRDINLDVNIDDIIKVMPFPDFETRLLIDAVDFHFDTASSVDIRGAKEIDAEADSVTLGGPAPVEPTPDVPKTKKVVFIMPPEEADKVVKKLRALAGPDGNPSDVLTAIVKAYRVPKGKPIQADEIPEGEAAV
jgi:hypothetical protein